jgi:(p)ppGpp synthase/HD superfamily hydrolase
VGEEEQSARVLVSSSPMFSQDLYVKALHFAAQAHGGQKTPLGMPYVVHLSSVTMEVIAALHAEPGHDDDLAVVSALLHDVVEDTSTKLDEITATFGPRVAAGVSALTKSAALDKPAAMRDSLARILEQPPEIAIVKLGDRISNLGPPPSRWSAAKIAYYREEGQLILDTLGSASPFLAARLAERIRTYP